jgi:hypothetical protein
MPQEPGVKRAIAFVDGQNLFHHARLVFGYKFPNYNVKTLAGQVCGMNGWELAQTRFYTGIPAQGKDPKWHGFWVRKLLEMSRQGVIIFSRELAYHSETVRLSDGTPHN